MRPPRYTLEPVVTLRRREVDEAGSRLAEAVATRQATERRHEAARLRRAAHDAQADAERDRETAALACGELRAADLARGDAWEARMAAERAALTGDVDRERVAELQARADETRAREQLAARQASADVVEKDRARWLDAQRRRTEAKEEEEAAEAFRPVR